MAEGYGRRGKKELVHFVNIALGSLVETEYLFGFAVRLGYCKTETADMEALIEEAGKLLWSFYGSL
jgi:four helix bundle protein